MLELLVFCLVFIIVNGWVIVEEEILILLSAFMWLDAAGSFLNKKVWSSIEQKGDLVKEKIISQIHLRGEVLSILGLIYKLNSSFLEREKIKEEYLKEFIRYIIKKIFVEYLLLIRERWVKLLDIEVIILLNKFMMVEIYDWIKKKNEWYRMR